ncbi:MAG: ABC transporter transmembrane domain-containing protein, partial [Bacteroidota bacterium]
MKTYFRILSYAGPLQRLLPLYFLASVFATFFGLINLSLLTPLLEVLFSATGLSDALATVAKPSFVPTLSYLKALFYYYFTNVIATHGKMNALYFVCLIMIISVLLANLFRYLAAIVAAELSINVVHHLRGELFGRVTQLHLGYFTSQRKGDIMARLLSDVQEVEHALADTLRVLCKEPTTLLGFFVVLFYMSPQLTLLALLSLPVVGGGVTAL